MGTVTVSLPADDTTADVADYNTPITTIINEINGGLDDANVKSGAAIDGAKLKDASITAPKIADANVTYAKTDGKIWWEEIGRTTLSSAGDTVSVASLPARKYLKIMFFGLDSGAVAPVMRFNNDSGNNYCTRVDQDGAGDSTAVNASYISIGSNITNSSRIISGEIINLTGVEKTVIANSLASVAGAGTAPTKRVNFSKWSNTDAQINRIDIVNIETGSFDTATELVVLGHN